VPVAAPHCIPRLPHALYARVAAHYTPCIYHGSTVVLQFTFATTHTRFTFAHTHDTFYVPRRVLPPTLVFAPHLPLRTYGLLPHFMVTLVLGSGCTAPSCRLHYHRMRSVPWGSLRLVELPAFILVPGCVPTVQARLLGYGYCTFFYILVGFCRLPFRTLVVTARIARIHTDPRVARLPFCYAAPYHAYRGSLRLPSRILRFWLRVRRCHTWVRCAHAFTFAGRTPADWHSCVRFGLVPTVTNATRWDYRFAPRCVHLPFTHGLRFAFLPLLFTFYARLRRCVALRTRFTPRAAAAVRTRTTLCDAVRTRFHTPRCVYHIRCHRTHAFYGSHTLRTTRTSLLRHLPVRCIYSARTLYARLPFVGL